MTIHKVEKLHVFLKSNPMLFYGDIIRVEKREARFRWVVYCLHGFESFGTKKEAEKFSGEYAQYFLKNKQRKGK